MGFEISDHFATVNLEFDDGEYVGFKARLRELNVGELADLTQLGSTLQTDQDDLTSEEAEAIVKVFDIIAGGLVEWNAELHGAPLAADITGVRQLPNGLLFELIGMWMSAGEVPAPLESTSPDGGPPAAVPIPMEPPSTSRPNFYESTPSTRYVTDTA